MASFFYWLFGQCEFRNCKDICVLTMFVLRHRCQMDIFTGSFWFLNGAWYDIYAVFGDGVSTDVQSVHSAD